MAHLRPSAVLAAGLSNTNIVERRGVPVVRPASRLDAGLAAGYAGAWPSVPTIAYVKAAMSQTETKVPVFDGPDSLVTAVAQDATTGQVLMVAHMNRAAWEETLGTGRAVYFSRSRGRLWRKGEESGNIQHVRNVYIDCDGDAVLLKVDQVGGAACHEGYASCFFREVTPAGLKLIAQRVFDPGVVYGRKG